MVDSKSTDKLQVLTEALKNVPSDKISKVKSFKLKWVSITCGETLVPVIEVDFFE